MKIYQISDTHLHRNPSKNKNAENRINNIPKDAFIIHCGDLTDDGYVEQYQEAQRIFKGRQTKAFFAPGNHDYCILGNIYKKSHAGRFDDMIMKHFVQYGLFFDKNIPVVNVIETKYESAIIIALDSNLETRNPFDFACGRIGDHQLEWLNDILDIISEYEEVPKLLFMHHHPFTHFSVKKLVDWQKLKEIIKGRVDIVLFGHQHKMKIWENKWSIRYFLAAPSLAETGKTFVINIQKGNIFVETVNLDIKV